VDLTHYIEKGKLTGGGAMHFALWDRCLMGAIFSLYQMVQGMGHMKEMILGNPREISNVYH
jgi:hypothetical protein